MYCLETYWFFVFRLADHFVQISSKTDLSLKTDPSLKTDLSITIATVGLSRYSILTVAILLQYRYFVVQKVRLWYIEDTDVFPRSCCTLKPYLLCLFARVFVYREQKAVRNLQKLPLYSRAYRKTLRSSKPITSSASSQSLCPS